MKLTVYTDYSLRVLLYLAHETKRSVTINELADFYGISRNHLVKVVHQLGINGLIKTIRGRTGGIELGLPAEDISVGQVVRLTEPDINLLDCFDQEKDNCKITTVCKLKGTLKRAQYNFLKELDACMLSDLIVQEKKFFNPEFPIHLQNR
ncbi:MAG: Rrf2 family transcriptional regulator [Betaproteobacteria bacterium]|nr:Rrf2 family transcriptional regulator [Betaproteobacteria bacterium]MDE2423908.1 Rrf2 family transcriptional regulator [Betaproteobacteria bacterium]